MQLLRQVVVLEEQIRQVEPAVALEVVVAAIQTIHLAAQGIHLV
jgi:hypothetical protein